MFRDGQELSEEVKMMEDSSEKTAPERELLPDLCMDVSNLNFVYSYMSNLLFNEQFDSSVYFKCSISKFTKSLFIQYYLTIYPNCLIL